MSWFWGTIGEKLFTRCLGFGIAKHLFFLVTSHVRTQKTSLLCLGGRVPSAIGSLFCGRNCVVVQGGVGTHILVKHAGSFFQKKYLFALFARGASSSLQGPHAQQGRAAPPRCLPSCCLEQRCATRKELHDNYKTTFAFRSSIS